MRWASLIEKSERHIGCLDGTFVPQLQILHGSRTGCTAPAAQQGAPAPIVSINESANSFD